MSSKFGQILLLTTESMSPLFLGCYDIDQEVHLNFVGNEEMHNMHISNEFELQPDRTTDGGVNCHICLLEIPHKPIMGKTVSPLLLGCFDPIQVILAGND